jgi:tRNA isopentenyl-2-thiomethyl-A-37 hydroxylase MiaE
MGKPVLSYLDERTKFILSELSGSNECPFVNVRLEEAYEILSFLLDNKNIIKEIGKSSRKWIEKYWSEKILIRQYVKLYEDLLDNPEKIRRQKNLQINDTKDHFFAIVQPDIIYRSRANKYFKSSNLFEKINIIIKKNFHNFKNYIRKLLGSI